MKWRGTVNFLVALFSEPRVLFSNFGGFFKSKLNEGDWLNAEQAIRTHNIVKVTCLFNFPVCVCLQAKPLITDFQAKLF